MIAKMIVLVPMLTTTQKAHATQEEWNQGDADGPAQASLIQQMEIRSTATVDLSTATTIAQGIR